MHQAVDATIIGHAATGCDVGRELDLPVNGRMGGQRLRSLGFVVAEDRTGRVVDAVMRSMIAAGCVVAITLVALALAGSDSAPLERGGTLFSHDRWPARLYFPTLLDPPSATLIQQIVVREGLIQLTWLKRDIR